MTIEIHNPELEAILKSRIKAGNFANIEDMLLDTFSDANARSNEDRKTKAMEAAACIRELRKDVKLERPVGISLREYAHIGHEY